MLPAVDSPHTAELSFTNYSFYPFPSLFLFWDSWTAILGSVVSIRLNRVTCKCVILICFGNHKERSWQFKPWINFQTKYDFFSLKTFCHYLHSLVAKQGVERARLCLSRLGLIWVHSLPIVGEADKQSLIIAWMLGASPINIALL